MNFRSLVRGNADRADEKPGPASWRNVALLFAWTAVIAGCGGGGGGDVAVAPPPPPVPPPVPQVRCAMDTSVTPSFEERRLPNKLDASDALSFSQQVLQASGFDGFGPAFALKLCADGKAGASTYAAATTLVKAEGQKLWQAALDRVQGRKVDGSLPQSDDRMLYWARLTMTLALRQWRPDFPMNDEQRAALENEFERASRGQYAIDFPEGAGYKRILVSGFDPFTLGQPGRDGDPSVRIGNPSGATILSLDGTTRVLPDGTKAVIRTFILPVNYGPFTQGMQEDTLGPWFEPGPRRVDASLSMSQGSGAFHLEEFNGRYHFALTPGNDNVVPACAAGGRYPAALDCDIFPPARWFGRETKPWKRDDPPQFTQASLPFQFMIDAKSGAGVRPPDAVDANGWPVIRRSTYLVTACTQAAEEALTTSEAARQAAQQAVDAAWAAFLAGTGSMESWMAAVLAVNEIPLPNPLEVNCAKAGGGGNYLSNESAYRNTLLRDVYGLTIPAGHIHTPVMTVFGAGSNRLITDATFEATRDAIVAQGRNLVFAVADSLTTPAPLASR